MTGRELIEYIKTNNAEEMLVCVQFRDGGGFYNGADDAAPSLGHATVQCGSDDYKVYDITRNNNHNAIIL